MSFVECTRCIFIMGALSQAICQIMQLQQVANSPTNPNVNYNILNAALIGISLVTLLAVLGCLWYYCRYLAKATKTSLDAYAPRTQSIVFPPLPQLSLKSIHLPNSVDCPCRTCHWVKSDVARVKSSAADTAC